ncbi:MAG: biopolymer transporter ExbD [Calditrichales bacterium]|nr:biopolymer transporter ExbD [Calditrichales bacterium]
MRRRSETLEMDLDIRPVMNLMVVLIPLLIASAEWVKLGIIEINVPPSKAAGGGGGEENENEVKEKELKLGLKVAVTHDGITVGNAMVLLSGEEGEEGPTVPKNEDGTYNYVKLKKELIEIKKKIEGKDYKDKNRAVLTASADIEYQVIIDIMDNIQTYENDKKEIVALFPEVNFGSIIQ